MEKRKGLIDRGYCGLRAANVDAFVDMLRVRIERDAPTVLVVGNIPLQRGREGARERLSRLVQLARESGLGYCQMSKSVLAHFFGADTMHGRASVIVKRYPVLSPELPRERRLWESQDERERLFEAIAAGLVILGPDAPFNAES